MKNDVAVYLDLDNLLIGAIEANLRFDVDLILHHIKQITGGRVVLRRAYGDWRQRANMTRSLAAAGFELQSTVRLGSNSKNLADMQMVVDAMGTLVDRQEFNSYVLITGDRDFVPLVQALRRRGKQVIGVGVKHTTSQRLTQLCDAFIYYDAIAAEANKEVGEDLSEMIVRALDQLLHDMDRIPASLLKQRIQAISKGTFAHSPHGRRSFSKVLNEYPEILQLEQEGTTLFVRRPGDNSVQIQPTSQPVRRFSDDEVHDLLLNTIDVLLADESLVRASLFKQRMQELSDGAFDESLQGDKSFRKFLDRFPDLLAVEQEGSTLYVRRSDGSPSNGESTPVNKVSLKDATTLLRQVLDDLLLNQSQVRASLLKQRMQELGDGVFDEKQFGDDSFRQFLERFPDLVNVQWKGTTLMVVRPQHYVDPGDLHLQYRTSLKKSGLRVVPSESRLVILKDLITLLRRNNQLRWRQMVNALTGYYARNDRDDISKSFVNDVLRVARRAEVIDVQNGGSLAKAPVYLLLSGERGFQEAVKKCDLTYLSEIMKLNDLFDLEQASMALYEDIDHVRYLELLSKRDGDSGISSKKEPRA